MSIVQWITTRQGRKRQASGVADFYAANRGGGLFSEKLARVTGQASPAGARVDVLCDVASHIALVPSRSFAVRLIKLVRDYGALIFAAGLVLIVNPEWMIWLLIPLTITNCSFLAVSVARSARAAMGSTGS